MPLERAPARDRSTWPILIGLLLLAVGLAGAAFMRWPVSTQLAATFADATRSLRGPPDVPPAAAPTHPEVATSEQAAPVAGGLTTPSGMAQPIVPSFDIVRVTPQGNAVVAGRAEPFAEVVIHDGDRVLGAAQADAHGEFVIVPEARVTPGGRELTLSARGRDGRETAGQDSVIVMVGPPPAAPASADETVASASPADVKPMSSAPDTPLAVLLPRDNAAPRILQAPNKPQALALNSVDYDQQGEIRFAGSAKPSTPVRVYVDNKPVGETSTDHAGQWTLTPPSAMPPGVHQLRVDAIAGTGKVQQRVELPFQRTATPLAGLSPGQMVVQPGSNLWRIARQAYGAGARYTVIYLANREQIRDPNRIYPGQIFAVPTSN